LIELLVVIVILGILLAVAVPTFLSQQSKAQDSRTQQYLTTAFKAIRAGLPGNNQVYPSSSSLVSWITQSEPELTAQRGDCLTGVTAAPTDAVLVDPSSTSTSLQLCARSQSGNVWKLTASNTGVQQLLDGTLVPLTMSGNEITDATRAADVEGDFLPIGSGVGIWQGTTNQETRPWDPATSGYTDAETSGKASWQSNAGIDIRGRMAASRYYASTAYRVNDKDWTGLLPNTTYVLSAWVKANNGVYGRIKVGSTMYTPTDTWQRVYGTGTTDATGAVNLGFHTSPDANVDVLISGVQMEAGTVPTPLVDGTRGSPLVQAPSGLLTASQGWVALRARVDWNASSPPRGTTNLIYFEWGDAANTRLVGYFDATAKTFRFFRAKAGSTSSAIGPTESFSTGTIKTLIFAWRAGDVELSVDGSPLVVTANTYVPSLSSPVIDIGEGGTINPNQESDSDFLWFATGTGTLSDVDAATINAWGNSDPRRSSFPAAARATMVWNGSGSDGSLK
jgi:type IV pilus assembly protein PilA